MVLGGGVLGGGVLGGLGARGCIPYSLQMCLNSRNQLENHMVLGVPSVCLLSGLLSDEELWVLFSEAAGPMLATTGGGAITT